ncbi:alpha/beta hydrolase [Nonomuraea sp. NPDC050022]|uniref:alpha/beta hydrolase n=1 Tax=unclassified Nonomuraea TaxID=2593643 RepID=UPI0033CA8BB3
MRLVKGHFRLLVADKTYVHVQVIQPPKDAARVATIIFSHGFISSGIEGGRRFVRMSNELARHGYSCILFDYRGWGYSDLSTEEVTFETYMADLHAVINHFSRIFPDQRLLLLGNSLGSAVATHVAAQRSDISSLVLWCLSAELYERYTSRLGPAIVTKGFTYDHEYRIGLPFLLSLKGRDTYSALRDANVPCLLVHGDADETASVELSRKAHQAAGQPSKLVIIPGAGHSFAYPPDSFRVARDVTMQWLEREVGRGG